jgi:UDP-galactopyranose mutase
VEIVVIGAGFAGACTALLLRDHADASVTILEQSTNVGGMLRTLETEDGLPYEYGPRVVSVFRGTPDIFPFLSQFLVLEEREIYQGTRLRPEYRVVPFPLDLESLRELPCGPTISRELAEIRSAGQPPRNGNLRQYLESSVGPTLTELAFEGFNRKFWGRRLEDMPADWGRLRRLERIAESGDFRLPSEAPHYYPVGGFNPLFERMLEGFDVRTGTRVERVERNGDRLEVAFEGGVIAANLVVATAPIDALLGCSFGPLEWRGYRVNVRVDGGRGAALGAAPDGIPFAWLYTPWPETPVCRTTDFGVIHHGPRRSGPSVVLEEVVDDSVAMYPVWWEDEKFYRYLEQAAAIPGLVPLGRLGLYKYVTMDTTLAMAQRLLSSLEEYLSSAPGRRYELLRHIRGDWKN